MAIMREERLSKRKSSDQLGQYVTSKPSASSKTQKVPGVSYLLVDGYNIIHAWKELERTFKD